MSVGSLLRICLFGSKDPTVVNFDPMHKKYYIHFFFRLVMQCSSWYFGLNFENSELTSISSFGEINICIF